VNGTYFEFLNQDGKRAVARIIKATKTDVGWLVDANLFINFDAWPSNYDDITTGEGRHIKELVLTSKTIEILFDKNAYDLAFVFTPEQLQRYGALLQGIDNAYVCRRTEHDEDANQHLVPFPSKDKPQLCPITHCFLAKVFFDLEKLRSRLNFDLSQMGELQGDFGRTYNPIGFSPETWDYLKFKLSNRFRIAVHLLNKRNFVHRLTHGIKRCKLEVPSDVQMIRIENPTSLEILRTILGTTVSYGIRGKRATLKDNHITINNNETLNIVVVEDNPPGRFCRVPSARFGGFDFTHDSVNELVVRTRYRKVHYRSENGSCIPLASLGLPGHLTKLLQTANWGNRRRKPRISIGSLFDKDHSTYEVISVNDTQVQAVPLFGNVDQPVHFDNVAEVEAAIALKAGVEDSSGESSGESSSGESSVVSSVD
jgi:hypothetical protein